MTPATIYNATVAVGTTMVGVGCGAAFGWPAGLIASGAIMLGLAVSMLRVR